MPSWIETFLTADPAERLRLARDNAHAGELRAYLGEAALAEYRALADTAGTAGGAHLSLAAPTNLVFVPGVMGSLLKSETLGGIWWIDARTRQHLNDLRLSPDGRSDAMPDHRVVACSTDPSYEPFLAAVLARDDFGHALFPYDWRKPLEASAGALKDLVVRVHGENGGAPVHLVAHSLGGLLVRTALLAHGEELWPRLGRIAFLATPHHGSPAIAGYLQNHLWGWHLMALLGRYLDRATFRSLWGVLSLLPAPRGVYPGTQEDDPEPWSADDPDDPYVHPCANFDLYQAAAWRLDLAPEERARLQAVLDGAASLHRRLHAAHRALPPERRERLLMIAGVGYKTLFRLAYRENFLGWASVEKVMDRVPGDPHREGDGRVPLASARLPGITTRYARGVHGGIPNQAEVYEDVFRWLGGEPLRLPETPEEALSRHLAPGEGESAAPHLDGTAGAGRFTDDPGYWSLDEPAASVLEDLEARLAAESLPELNRVRLL